MAVTKKQAEDFVRFGEDHYSSLKILKNMIYVYWGATWILWVPFAVAGRGLVFCIVITLLALLYTTAYYVLKSNRIQKTYRLRFLTNSISISFMYLFFYLFTIFIINVTDIGSTLWQDCELTICFAAFPLLNVLFTLRAIKKNAYDKDKPKMRTGIIVKCSYAAFFGMFIGRILERYLTQSQSISLIIFLVEIVLFFMSFASSSILRAYFAYKQDIVADAKGDTASALLVDDSKKSIGIRMVNFLLKVLLFGFAIIMLYAMSQLDY